MKMKTPPSPLYWVSILCLLLSGISGLVCQVAWNRYLALFLGHSSYATVVVLCSFMGGLALGGLWLGGRADRTQRPLLLYAWLEAGIAAYAFLFPSYFDLCEGVYTAVARNLDPSGTLSLGLKFAFGIAMVACPTILMGGTLPVLTKLVTHRTGEIGERVGALYAINSLGAVAGCLIADFWWIPSVGLPSTVLFAGAINTAVALIAFYASRLEQPNRATRPIETDPPTPTTSNSTSDPVRATSPELRTILIAVALSGFAAMLYEVAWNRMLALTLGSSTHAFSIMVATFITGISIGSWIITRWTPRNGVLVAFAQCELALAVILLFSMFQYESIPYWFSRAAGLIARSEDTHRLYQWLQTSICFGVMLAPTICLGMTLPLASQAATSVLERTGSSVGTVFACNTGGTVLGAALTGLWLLPALGLPRLLALGIAFNGCIAFMILRHDWLQQKRSRWLSLPLGSALFVGFVGSLFESQWQHSLILGLFRDAPPQSARAYQREANSYDVRYYKDGATATVSVQRQIVNNAEKLMLRVNGKVDASNGGDVATQLLLAHIPMLLHPRAENVMVIGLGSGMTCGAALQHPSVQHLDAIEISPEVAEAARLFEPYNGAALKNPKLRLRIDDAKSFLRLAQEPFDVIISEPSNPWMSGVAGVFSREHFEACRRALRPTGLMAQWVHIYEANDEVLKTVLATFYSVFPNGSVWQTTPGDLILIGTPQPLSVDLTQLAARFAEPAVAKDLGRVDIYRLPVLLSREILSADSTPHLVEEGVAIESDLYPTLEYAAQKAFFLRQRSSLMRELDENLSPRATTLLARYVKSTPLQPLDLQGMILFFNSFNVPEPLLARSVMHRWRTDSPQARLPSEFLASVMNPNAREELNAITLAQSKQEVLASTQKDPELLKWYGQALMQTHRGRRSIVHLPDSAELENVLERLVTIDPANARVHLLRLAELAWDKGDDDRCLTLGEQALSPGNTQYGPLQFDIDPVQPARITRCMLEIHLARGQIDRATQLCREAFQRNYAGPNAFPSHRPLELSCRKILARLAQQPQR